MDQITYEHLKKANYNEVVYYIMDRVRGKNFNEDNMSLVVAVSTLAYITKVHDTDAISYLKDKIEDETTVKYLGRINKENNNLIYDISNKFDGNSLKAAALFSEPKRFTEADISATPDGIIELVISLLSLNNNDIILDLGSGVSSYLIQAAYKSGSNNVYGVEINTNNVIISNLRRFLVNLPINIIQGNIISQDYSYLSANKVFSNYPIGMRFFELEKYIENNVNLNKYFKGAKKTVSGEWVFGLASYLNTNKTGKTVILMSNAGTWNKPDEPYRKKFVENGLIEGIILLPNRLFASTMTPLTMMILSQNNEKIRMVDATDIYTEGRRQNTLEASDIEAIMNAYYSNSDISRDVKVQDVAEQEYILNPQRYIQINKVVDGIPLKDVSISINRGAMIKSSELDELISKDETNYQYLMLQNIQDGVVDSNLPYLVDIDKRLIKYCIKDKNLIISKISPFKVAMVHKDNNDNILANGNLYFIELDEEKVNPVYVLMFLQSELGMAQLNRYSKGAAMKSISIQDLKEILIPRISRKEQDKLAEEYINLSDELVVLQNQIDMIHEKIAKLVEEVI